jgi:hypothetical protein
MRCNMPAPLCRKAEARENASNAASRYPKPAAAPCPACNYASACQEVHDQQEKFQTAYNRRGSKDSQLK